MAKVSILIPGRNEIFFTKTVDDIFAKATGEIKVTGILDGYWPAVLPAERPNLTLVHFGAAKGMRAGINAAANLAKGKYLLKCDAHCRFAEGFDEVLQADCDDNWVVIPRRYSLDAENWIINENGKPRSDYHYLCYPHWDKAHDAGMHGVEWFERGRQRQAPEYDIDDNMSCQGSVRVHGGAALPARPDVREQDRSGGGAVPPP